MYGINHADESVPEVRTILVPKKQKQVRQSSARRQSILIDINITVQPSTERSSIACAESKSEETKVDENPINLQVRFGHVCKTRSYLYIDDNLLGLPWRRLGHIHVACAKPSGYRCRWHSVVYTIAAPTSSSCMKSLQGGKLGGLVHENVLAFGEFSIQNQMSAVNINF